MGGALSEGNERDSEWVMTKKRKGDKVVDRIRESTLSYAFHMQDIPRETLWR